MTTNTTKKTSASTTLSDGWHNMKDGKSYYVSDGRIVRGLSCDGLHTLYPYRWSRVHRCYVNVTPRATYNALRYLRWF